MQRLSPWILVTLLLAILTLSPRTTPAQLKLQFWPQSWSEYVGKTVTLDGKAIDEKTGAVLICVYKAYCPAIYIDGLDSWPDGFYLGGDKGKRVRVTGTVIERDDLPVFIENKNEPIKQGIPVPIGSDLKKMRRRFLLKEAKWDISK